MSVPLYQSGGGGGTPSAPLLLSGSGGGSLLGSAYLLGLTQSSSSLFGIALTNSTAGDSDGLGLWVSNAGEGAIEATISLDLSCNPGAELLLRNAGYFDFYGDAVNPTLRLNGKTSGKANITCPDAAGTPTLTTPTASGTLAVVAAASGQPAFSDLSGSASAAQLPNPAATTLGGVKSKAAVASNFLTQIGTDGSVSQAQPAFSDLSGSASLTSQVSGVLPAANGGAPAALATAGQGGFFAPWGDWAGMYGQNVIGTTATGNVRACQFVMPYTLTFTQLTINVNTTSNGNNFMVSIYSADGSTKIVTAVFALSSATGRYTTTVSATTLKAGTAYFLAWGADNNVVNPLGAGSAAATGAGIFNNNYARLGLVANKASGTTMPTTLGAVTGSATVPLAVFLEP